MDAAEPFPRLGEVLLARGLLTEDQLRAALAEQERTGKRLGRLLVEHGVPAHAVAMALADQSGGVLQTEYGIATGWRSSQEAAEPTAPPVESPAERERALRALEASLADKDRALAEVADASRAKDEQLAALERELHAVRQELAALKESGERGDGGDDRHFVVVASVAGRYVVQLGRGDPPAVGTRLRLPGCPDTPVVVTRAGLQRCLYAAPG